MQLSNGPELNETNDLSTESKCEIAKWIKQNVFQYWFALDRAFLRTNDLSTESKCEIAKWIKQNVFQYWFALDRAFLI